MSRKLRIAFKITTEEKTRRLFEEEGISVERMRQQT